MGVAPGVYDTICTLLSCASVTSLLKCYGKSSVAAWLHFKTWIRWKKLIPCHFKLCKITPSIQLNDLKWLRELHMQYIWDRVRPFILRGFREPYEGALNCDMWPLLLEPPDSFPPLPLSPREGSTLFSPQYTPEPQGLIHALHSAFFIRWALFKTSAGGRGAPCRQRSESLNLMFWEHKLSHISVSLHIAFPKTSLSSSMYPNQSSRYVPTHLLRVPSSATFSMKISLVPPGKHRDYSPYGHLVHTSLIVIATSSVSLLSGWALCKDRDRVSSSLCPQGILQTFKYLLNKWLNHGIWRNSQCATIRARD